MSRLANSDSNREVIPRVSPKTLGQHQRWRQKLRKRAVSSIVYESRGDVAVVAPIKNRCNFKERMRTAGDIQSSSGHDHAIFTRPSILPVHASCRRGALRACSCRLQIMVATEPLIFEERRDCEATLFEYLLVKY